MNLINEEKENITRLNGLKEREDKVYETISVGSITRSGSPRENSVWELEKTHGIECSECGDSHGHGVYFVEYGYKNFLGLFKIPYSSERNIKYKCSSCLEDFNGKEIKELPEPEERNAVMGF